MQLNEQNILSALRAVQDPDLHKNIVELNTSKNNLLQAEQQLIQSKYTTLLNLAMLRFYQGEAIRL